MFRRTADRFAPFSGCEQAPECAECRNDGERGTKRWTLVERWRGAATRTCGWRSGDGPKFQRRCEDHLHTHTHATFRHNLFARNHSGRFPWHFDGFRVDFFGDGLVYRRNFTVDGVRRAKKKSIRASVVGRCLINCYKIG